MKTATEGDLELSSPVTMDKHLNLPLSDEPGRTQNFCLRWQDSGRPLLPLTRTELHVKLFLCLVKSQDIKAYGGEMAHLHAFFTLALDLEK
jgi:hypothetical protein